MNHDTQYSDEHINAYIDGELDSDERTRLLRDGQKDDDLQGRIKDAQVLKEKVQLAYGSTDDYARMIEARSAAGRHAGRGITR